MTKCHDMTPTKFKPIIGKLRGKMDKASGLVFFPTLLLGVVPQHLQLLRVGLRAYGEECFVWYKNGLWKCSRCHKQTEICGAIWMHAGSLICKACNAKAQDSVAQNLVQYRRELCLKARPINEYYATVTTNTGTKYYGKFGDVDEIYAALEIGFGPDPEAVPQRYSFCLVSETKSRGITVYPPERFIRRMEGVREGNRAKQQGLLQHHNKPAARRRRVA